MKIFYGFTRFKGVPQGAVVALGVFDGVHRGHQKIIRHAVRRAKKIEGASLVMTFDPHPVHVLNPLKYCPLIIPLRHRLKLIERWGIHAAIVMPFTKRFAQLGCEAFVKRYLLDKLHLSEIVVGDDFHFGRRHQGTARRLKRLGRAYGFRTTIIPARGHGKKIISSSRIREYISKGVLAKAARLLGRPVSVTGRVIHGDSRGQTLGYPTANIEPTQGILLPAGVFIVRIHMGNHRYHGLANVGRRPSFKTIRKVNVEVHIFNFKKNIYDKEIVIEFIKKIRDEKVFRCELELMHQIQMDEKHAHTFFKKG